MTTTPTTAAMFAPLPIGLTAPSRHPLSKDVRDGAYPVTPQSIRALVAAEDQLSDLADRERAATNETFPAMLTRVSDALASGEPLPDDLTAQAQEALAVEEHLRVTEIVIARLRAGIQQRWGVVLRAHVDEMLAGLSGQLDEVLNEVRSAAAVVDGLDLVDPEAVGEATAKQRTALADLKALRPRYRRLRSLQEALLRQVRETPPAGSGQPNWRSFFATHHHEFSAIATNGQPSDDLPTVLWFRRLLGRDDVWLPTLTQLTEALAQPAPKRSPHTDSDPDRQAHLRHREAVTTTHVGLLGLNNR